MACPVGYVWDGTKCVKIASVPKTKPEQLPNYKGTKPKPQTLPNQSKEKPKLRKLR